MNVILSSIVFGTLMPRFLLILLIVSFSKAAYAQANNETKRDIVIKQCETSYKLAKSSEVKNPTKEEIKLAGNLIDLWFFLYYWGSKDINDSDCDLGKIDNLNNYQEYNLYLGNGSGYKFKNVSGLEHSLVKIFTVKVEGDVTASNAYLVLFKDQKAILFKIYKGLPSEEQAIDDVRDLLKNRLKPLFSVFLNDGSIIHQFQ